MIISNVLLTGYFWLITVISVILTSLICFPLYFLTDSQSFTEFYQLLISALILFFMKPFWSFTIQGKVPTYQCVMVANHESFIDTLLMARIPLYKKFIMAGKYSKIPLFGQLCLMAGSVPFDSRASRGTIAKCQQAMQDGSSFAIYPEGKRSNQGLLEFKTGAFQLAYSMKVPIVPITLWGTGKALGIGTWCQCAHLELIIHDPVYLSENSVEEIEKIRQIIKMEDHLSEIPVDLFFHLISYLSFDDTLNLRSINSKFHQYSVNPEYTNKWKALIDRTYSDVYDYPTLLFETQYELKRDLNLKGRYNYLIYLGLISKLDPISQLMIYYRQNDQKSFNHPYFTQYQRFLALFLLNKRDEITKYLPEDDYSLFIDLMDKKEITQHDLNGVAINMARDGSMKGLLLMQEKGANIHANKDEALQAACIEGHLAVVKYLVQQGADVHDRNNRNFMLAHINGHGEVLEYLNSLP